MCTQKTTKFMCFILFKLKFKFKILGATNSCLLIASSLMLCSAMHSIQLTRATKCCQILMFGHNATLFFGWPHPRCPSLVHFVNAPSGIHNVSFSFFRNLFTIYNYLQVTHKMLKMCLKILINLQFNQSNVQKHFRCFMCALVCVCVRHVCIFVHKVRLSTINWHF